MSDSRISHIPPNQRPTHNLRTMLTVVLGRVQMARRQLDKGDYAGAGRHLAEVEAQVRQAVTLSEFNDNQADGAGES